VICVALTPSDGSELRNEVESKVEVFVDLSEALSRGVPAAAHALNQLQPHVLVNLNGYTNGGRLELFALRPAPLQVIDSPNLNEIPRSSIHDREVPLMKKYNLSVAALSLSLSLLSPCRHAIRRSNSCISKLDEL